MADCLIQCHWCQRYSVKTHILTQNRQGTREICPTRDSMRLQLCIVRKIAHFVRYFFLKKCAMCKSAQYISERNVQCAKAHNTILKKCANVQKRTIRLWKLCAMCKSAQYISERNVQCAKAHNTVLQKMCNVQKHTIRFSKTYAMCKSAQYSSGNNVQCAKAHNVFLEEMCNVQTHTIEVWKNAQKRTVQCRKNGQCAKAHNTFLKEMSNAQKRTLQP